VVLRFLGSPLASGGSIDTSSVPGYTLHTFTTTGANSFTLTAPVTTTLSGNLTGTGGFTLDTPSTLVLTGTNSYDGETIVAAGVLQVGNGGSTGSLGSGNVTNNASLVVNRTGSLEIGGTITGTGSLTKQAAGSLTLSGTNTFSGGTTISAGTLLAGSDSAFGTDAVTIGAAGVTLGTTADRTLANAIDLANSGVVDSGSHALTLSGAISGAGDFTKTGTGSVTLSGANTFTGGLTVSAGTLATSAANRLVATAAPVVASGATLSLGGDQTLAVVTGSGALDLAAGTLTVGSTTGEFAGALTGAGSLLKSGAGTLTLSGASPDYTGAVTVSGGTLLLDNNGALNTNVDLTLNSGATLNVAAGRTVPVKSFTLTSGTLTGSGSLEAITTTVDSATIATPIADAPGQNSDFVKTGTGTTTVTAANTFTGTLDIQGGTVTIGSGGSFAAASSLSLASGATLDLGGTTQAFAALNGAGGTVDVSSGALSVSGAGSFAGVISGTGSFTKSGTGNLVLSGTNTYDGGTTISGGRLSVNGSLATTPVSVTGGTLGGSGSIAGTVAVANGGTLAPGNSIESLKTGAANFASGSTFDYEVDSTDLNSLGTAADLLVVDGSVTITDGTVLNFADLNQTPQAFVEDTTVFAMINYTGALTGTFNYNGTALADGDRFTVGSQMWEIDYNASAGGLNFTGDYQPSSSFVTVTAVPEPSTYVMLAIAGGIAAVAARRRRKA